MLAQAAGGAVVLFGVLEPLLSPSLPMEVRRLALSTLAGALGVGFTTKYKDEFASELVDTQLLTLVLSALGEPGLQVCPNFRGEDVVHMRCRVEGEDGAHFHVDRT